MPYLTERENFREVLLKDRLGKALKQFNRNEMVHLIEKPHSRRFWQLISRVIPDYEEHVRWLNENCIELDL